MAAESLPLTTDDFYPVPGVGISGGKGRGHPSWGVGIPWPWGGYGKPAEIQDGYSTA